MTDKASIEDRIRTAALHLFCERGYGATTVDDIARSAGVGIGTLYRRWPDKPALANEVYRFVGETITAYHATPSQERGRKARFVHVIRSFTRFAAEQPQMLQFWAGQPHDAYLDANNRKQQQEHRIGIRQLMTELGITASADVAAAMVLGTLVQCVETGTQFDPDDLAARLWKALG